MDKIFVSHGDLIVDNIYDSNLHLIKQDGGGCNWNDLYNLSIMGEKCYAIGSAGNDKEGILAIKALKDSGINTDSIIIEEKNTNIMNIVIPDTNLEDNSVQHLWYSPITNECTMNFSKNLPIKIPSNILNSDLYVILDKFLPINLEFIKNLPKNSKICLDIGHIRFFEHFTKQYLNNFFSYANVIQINDNVLDFLFEKLGIRSLIELYKSLDLELLILTQGKKGATFVYKENNVVQTLSKSPEYIIDIVDSSGAGDAFFSVIIKEYAYSNKIDTSFVNKVFDLANKASRQIISHVGSRISKKDL